MIDIGSITSQSAISPTTPRISFCDHWDHFLARIGIRRGDHRVAPGLYALGNPSNDSPVFVSANYSLSFDALRSSLGGIDGYILVLDTRGINVWCAAGKGTFGTDEIVNRVFATHLKEVVTHRKLILPQLGAPGVAAFEVKKRTGFWVEYGPVRASDLPEYLTTHKATPEMRKVVFNLSDRLVLIPVEVVQSFLPMLAVVIVLYFVGGWLSSLAAIAAVLTGTVLFPILLPWIPTHNFSTKGFLVGVLAAVPFALSPFFRHPDWTWYHRIGQGLEFLLAMPAVTAFIALNFTGSTTFHPGAVSSVRCSLTSRPWPGLSGQVSCLPSFSSSFTNGSSKMLNAYLENTLVYDPALCNGCGVCVDVCPHAAFEMDGRLAVLARPQTCMECGACQLNCVTGAIHVESGVGCAAAMIQAALKGQKEVECGCS